MLADLPIPRFVPSTTLSYRHQRAAPERERAARGGGGGRGTPRRRRQSTRRRDGATDGHTCSAVSGPRGCISGTSRQRTLSWSLSARTVCASPPGAASAVLAAMQIFVKTLTGACLASPLPRGSSWTRMRAPRPATTSRGPVGGLAPRMHLLGLGHGCLAYAALLTSQGEGRTPGLLRLHVLVRRARTSAEDSPAAWRMHLPRDAWLAPPPPHAVSHAAPSPPCRKKRTRRLQRKRRKMRQRSK
eukprot:scaffold16569_cov60-Phaeocystis_antarctica.AAC.9